MLLADEGADVIKIEQPGTGDWIRDHIGQVAPRVSPYHLYVNRNKRSVSIDLTSLDGQKLLPCFACRRGRVCDWVHSYGSPRLGMSFDQVHAVRPDIVYCQATGFGATGPYTPLPVHGEMMSALVASPRRERSEAGDPRIVSSWHEPDPPEGVVVGPLFAAFGVAAALYRRERTGEGTYLDVACSDAVLAAAHGYALLALNEGRYVRHAMFPAMEGRIAARYTYYETADGKFLLFCPEEPKFWHRFCEVVGRPDLIEEGDDDVTTDYGDDDLDLYRELQKVFLGRTLAEWMACFVENRIPGAPTLTYLEARDDPHVRYRGIVADDLHPTAGRFTTLRSPLQAGEQGSPTRIPAATVGEHTRQVLEGLGLTTSEFEELERRGIVFSRRLGRSAPISYTALAARSRVVPAGESRRHAPESVDSADRCVWNRTRLIDREVGHPLKDFLHNYAELNPCEV